MKALQARLGLAMVVLATAVTASSQTAGITAVHEPVPAAVSDAPAIPVPSATPAVQVLQSFRESDVKFDVDHLMSLLRDRKHEGWVLAAYPDPKTGQPLIGAGVSLDLPARDHPQRDPLNPNPFIEPASAELWQAAGLEPARLNQILDDFHQKLTLWDMHAYRSHIKELPSQITEEEANQLLRIAIVQSILNAKAYCRSFERLTGSQQPRGPYGQVIVRGAERWDCRPHREECFGRRRGVLEWRAEVTHPEPVGEALSDARRLRDRHARPAV